jgi:hypothetical protein
LDRVDIRILAVAARTQEVEEVEVESPLEVV